MTSAMTHAEYEERVARFTNWRSHPQPKKLLNADGTIDDDFLKFARANRLSLDWIFCGDLLGLSLEVVEALEKNNLPALKSEAERLKLRLSEQHSEEKESRLEAICDLILRAKTREADRVRSPFLGLLSNKPLRA